MSPDFIDAMHCNPTKIQALKDACNHSKVSSQAKRNQNLNTSAGKVTITCNRSLAQALQNQHGEYYRTFNTFKDFRAIFAGKAVDKEFHIVSFLARRESIVDVLAKKRLSGTSMEFPPAQSRKGGRWFPAFRITPHPCQQS